MPWVEILLAGLFAAGALAIFVYMQINKEKFKTA